MATSQQSDSTQGQMTRYEEMDERARRIVRGTMEPLSGWYDSPDDLEIEIRRALGWAYEMGVNRGPWRELARELLRTVMLPAAPAGSTYDLRPARHVIEAFRHILPDVWDDDFQCECVAGRAICRPVGRLRRLIEDGALGPQGEE